MSQQRHPISRCITGLALAAAALLSAGCTHLGGEAAGVSDLPYLNPGRNQIMAWIPRQQAQTAVVAQAMAHIALAEAKKAAESELCGGTWMFTGQLQQDDHASLARAPQELGGFTGWHIRISWDPQLSECGVSAQQYALALSQHLPDWMMTQSGAPLALYHQGTALYHQDDSPYYALALNDH